MKPQKALANAKKVCAKIRAMGRKASGREALVVRAEELLNVGLPRQDLNVFRDKHKGRRCFIIGNGPSLDRMDLRRLAPEVTFACNMIFTKTVPMKEPTYYCFTDHKLLNLVEKQVASWWSGTRKTIRFLYRPARHYTFEPHYRQSLGRMLDARTFLLSSGPDKQFSTRAAKYCCQGFTVTYLMLQLAYYMGCNPVYLIGCDCTSNQHFSGDYYQGNRGQLRPGNGFSAASKTKIWEQALGDFRRAKRAFEADGRTILNATLGGLLDMFQRVQFEDVIRG